MSNNPVRYDHTIVIGDTYSGLTLTLADAAGTPYDVTGVTGECILRRTLDGPAELEPVVSVVDGPAGEVAWEAPDTETAALVPGPYIWALRLTWPGGQVKTYLVGTITAVTTAVVGA